MTDHQQTARRFSSGRWRRLRSLRVRKASELLRDTNLKIYQVAEQVGYSDTASFYRVFKEELGVSPAQYKKNLPEK